MKLVLAPYFLLQAESKQIVIPRVESTDFYYLAQL